MQSELTVVGGGVIGLVSAWRLAQAGLRVTLIDRVQIGRESSWAAAGILSPSGDALLHPPSVGHVGRDVLFQAAQTSLKSYPSFAEELLELTGIDIELSLHNAPTSDWRQPGVLILPPSDDTTSPLADVAELRPYHGSHSWWLPEEGQVENRKLVDALRKAAVAAGVIIRDGTLVRKCSIEGDRVTGLLLETGELLQCERLLLCAGAWSSKIAGLPFGIPIQPLAGQMVVLRAEKKVPNLIYSPNCYLVPRRDGRLLVGATLEETGFAKRVTAGGVMGLLQKACDLLPSLADSPLESHWAGLRPITPDGLPIIGKTPLENVFVAAGHGRNGILLTPWTGQVISDLIFSGHDVPDSFSVARFPAAKGA